MVSHLRHLPRAATDVFIIVADGKPQPSDGDPNNLSDWLRMSKLTTKMQAIGTALPIVITTSVSVITPATIVNKKEQKRADAEERQKLTARRKSIECKFKKLEEKITKSTAQKAVVDERLANLEMHDSTNKKELKTLLTDQRFHANEITLVVFVLGQHCLIKNFEFFKPASGAFIPCNFQKSELQKCHAAGCL